MNGEVDRDMTHYFQRDPPLCLHWNSPVMRPRSDQRRYNLEDAALPPRMGASSLKNLKLEDAFEGLSIMRKQVRFEDEMIGDTGPEMSIDNSTSGSKEGMKDVMEENIEEMEERGEVRGEVRGKKRPFMSVPARFGNIAPLSLYSNKSSPSLFKPLSKKRPKVDLGLSKVTDLNGEK